MVFEKLQPVGAETCTGQHGALGHGCDWESPEAGSRLPGGGGC